jgi:UDP-N-acetylmuramate dehydrogenase
MHNVGAYGQEVSDAVVLVRAYDREARRFVELEPAACAFAYRSSIFRGSARWILVEIVFRFACGRESAPLRYAELSAALGSERAPLPRVREAVLALRRAKGMVVDPADPESRSAGSFFTNPVLDPDALAALVARVERAFGADMAEKMPRFSAANGTKVSAAWLIERAGFAKGYTLGQVGISRKHALALVNRGGASTAELLELARAVRAAVEARFGVLLEFEPVIV